MSARIIDGRQLARRLRERFRERVTALATRGVVPGLAVILVGDNPASHVYVANKVKACEESGVRSFMHRFPANVAETELLDRIAAFNLDAATHGVLVQLPLPPQVDVRRVLESIVVDKDVDGFHLYNVGALVVGNSIFPPCTPYGVQLLLETTGIDVAGKNVVVIGASNIVGKPMALMLLQKEATVTICHAKTRDLARHTIGADILVVAAGRPGLIKGEMVKEGAIVIDVGINRVVDGDGKVRIVGDVCAGEMTHAAALTPVPGGVGPMTITMLLVNTLEAAERIAH